MEIEGQDSIANEPRSGKPLRSNKNVRTIRDFMHSDFLDDGRNDWRRIDLDPHGENAETWFQNTFNSAENTIEENHVFNSCDGLKMNESVIVKGFAPLNQTPKRSTRARKPHHGQKNDTSCVVVSTVLRLSFSFKHSSLGHARRLLILPPTLLLYPSMGRPWTYSIHPRALQAEETRADTTKAKNMMKTAEMKTLRTIKEVTLRDQIRSKATKEDNESQDIARFMTARG
ncbi:hypothetical protein Trydic_g19223 [Trypoxylus dichotomus]